MSAISDPRTSKSDTIPLHRQELLKWNGWGYKDTKFIINDSDQTAMAIGDRYKISGHKLPLLGEWFRQVIGASFDRKSIPQPEMTADKLPKAIINEDFLNEFKKLKILSSDDPQDRLFRAHGHTMDELFMLRYGKYERIPDLVVWPANQDEVEQIVNLSVKHNVTIIPYGGGTSVTWALLCPTNEKRMIISLDTQKLVT
jgi:alkyldihydroxyacetonephosphate synthase